MQPNKIIPRFLALSFVLLLLLSISLRANGRPSSSQRAKTVTVRRSVLDYYYLLPSLGIGYSATQQERRELLKSQYHPVIDVGHDYLRFQPDSSPAEQLAVFRARNQPDLVAESMPDFGSDYNFFALYRLQNGKLRDVTRQVLPMPVQTDRLLYELPRVGTTIRVFSFSMERHSRRHAFNLRWQGGRFVKVS